LRIDQTQENDLPGGIEIINPVIASIGQIRVNPGTDLKRKTVKQIPGEMDDLFFCSSLEGNAENQSQQVQIKVEWDLHRISKTRQCDVTSKLFRYTDLSAEDKAVHA
jgi:hypothetical protein